MKELADRFSYSSFDSMSRGLEGPSICPFYPGLAALKGFGDEAVHWSQQLDSLGQHLMEAGWVLVHSRCS